VAFAHYYPLSGGIAAQLRKIRGELFDAAHPPAGTTLLFEGLPSMDAGFAVDVVAAKWKQARVQTCLSDRLIPLKRSFSKAALTGSAPTTYSWVQEAQGSLIERRSASPDRR
jgi:hypothetical protein